MPDFSTQREKTTKLVKKVGDKALDFQTSSSRHLSKYVTRRTKNIVGIRRFMTGWLALVCGLCLVTILSLVQVISAARTTAPKDGGVYTEGMIGTLNNLNPMFGSGTLDDSAARLLFNGLLRYNTDGKLVPDLAKSWSVGEDRKTYTVTLRDDVLWHDGQSFSADDVLFTVQAIQNPQTRSPLFASWQGIKVAKVSDQEVRFELPAVFAPFTSALTLPMLPSHLLAEIPSEQLRSASFNSQPVGTGPFVFNTLRTVQSGGQQLEASKNDQYFRGTPRLDRFSIHTYQDNDAMAKALRDREITAAVDLRMESVNEFVQDTSIRLGEIPLNSGVFGFFKTTNPILSDASVRRALAASIDRTPILDIYEVRYAPLKSPLLRSQLGFDSGFQQKTDREQAKALLDQAGWQVQEGGGRAKDGNKLAFTVTTSENPQYAELAGELQRQWTEIGASVEVQLLTTEQLQQTALSAHAYDVLIYGISLGHDPDVYAYWHSSQAKPGGLNFSEWESSRADASLDTARTRLESVLREARYKTFQDEWIANAPAVALYQPRVSYAYHQNATGFRSFGGNNASDRLTNVEEWTVSNRRVDRTP